MSNKKAVVLRDVLKSNLALRLPNVTTVASNDANGDPVLSIGTIGIAGQGAVVRIKPVAPVATVLNIIGQAQETWTPNLVQIALETSAVAHVPVLINPTLFLVLAECLLLGCETQMFLETNGTAPTTAVTMVASKLEADFSNSIQFGSQAAI